MFKVNIPEIDLKLDRNLDTYSQLELARMIFNMKNFVHNGNDVKTVINGYELDTVGCNTEEEFVEKYHDFFIDSNIPNFIINKVTENENSTYFSVSVDNIPGVISTKDCMNIGDVKIKNEEIFSKLNSVDAYNILHNLNKKMNLDVEMDREDVQNDDVSELSDTQIPVQSNSNEATMVNDFMEDSVVFEEYEADRNGLLNSDTMQVEIAKFNNRNTNSEIENYSEREIEFQNKLKELESLDFTEASDVYKWIDSIIPYVNDPSLNLSFGEVDGSEYDSVIDYIIDTLGYKGYITNPDLIELNDNIGSRYRKLISYQLKDLKDYQFFAYEYADEIRDNIVVNSVDENQQVTTTSVEETSEDLSELIDLQTQRQLVLNKIALIEDYEKGLFNFNREKTVGFDDRKNELRARIEELENGNSQDTDQNYDINTEFLKAEEKLKLLAIRTGKDQTKAMNFYDAASGIPFTNNIISAFEKAAELPDTDELKQPLIDALLKMDVRYSSFKNEDDAKLVQDTLDRLGIKPLSVNKGNEDEILRLNNEIQAIEREENSRIEKEKPIKEKLFNQLDEINKQIEDVQNNKNEVSKAVEEVSTNNTENETYLEKLERIASEEPISVDLERRLDKEDQWMEVNTAMNLGKLNEENQQVTATPVEETVNVEEAVVEEEVVNEPVVEENTVALDTVDVVSNEEVNVSDVVAPIEEQSVETEVVEEVEDFIPREDSLTIPHPIKAIKKASITLIEKVRNSDFNQKLRDALNWLKEHKKVSMAVATGLLFGATVMLSSGLEKADALSQTQAATSNQIESTQDENSNEVIQEEVKTTDTTLETVGSQNEEAIEEVNTVVEKTDSEISQEVIQNTLEGVLEGDKVYSNVDDALNNTNALSTTESQKDNSWSNSEAGAFYDSNSEVLTREQAEQKIAAGEQVVVRYDNNGVPIGYVVGQLSNEDTLGLSR